MNVLNSLLSTYPKEALGRLVKQTAKMTGVSPFTVWRVKKEHQECGGKFKERVVKRNNFGRNLRISKFQKPILDAISRKVLDFVAVTEKPSCKKILEQINNDPELPSFSTVCTLRRLLVDIGFNSKFELVNAPVEATHHGTAPVRKTKPKPSLNLPDSPFKVIPINGKDFSAAEIIYRSENILLCKRSLTPEKYFFEVNFENPNPGLPHAFSLYRSDTKLEATNMYLFLKKIVPIFATSVPDLFKKENLQELTDVANKHVGWSPSHIAAHLGWNKCFRNEQFSKLVNEMCSETLATPIHVAIEAQRADVIQTLIHINAQLNAIDKKGNTIFHVAANTRKDIIQSLLYWETPALINKTNMDGHTPLQIACMANNAACITELLSAGADANPTLSTLGHNHSQMPQPQRMEFAIEAIIPEDKDEPVCDDPMQLYTEISKNGGTPLHLAETPQCLEALVEFGCHLDAKNNDGNTAVHVFVTRNRLSCLATLLSCGANPNVISADGSTALQIAVKVGDPYLVQALLIFGADPNLKDPEGFSPLHLTAAGNFPNKEFILFILHSMNASRCVTLCHQNCSRGCSINSQWNGIAPLLLSQIDVPRLFDGLLGLPTNSIILANSKPVPSKPRCRILCLDDGGMRVLLIIEVLRSLKLAMGCDVLKYFDMIVGTGLSGVLALALSIGKSLEACRGLIFKLKDKVFTCGRAVDVDALTRFFKREFGEHLTLANIKFGRVLVTGLLSEHPTPEIAIFRNFISAKSILRLGRTDVCFDHPGLFAWQVANACCSVYFHNPKKHQLGAWFVTNPVTDALTEIHKRNLAMKAVNRDDDTETIGGVIALGSGLLPYRLNPHNLNLSDKIADLESVAVERGQVMCSLLDVPYFRINPPLTEIVSPETTDAKVLIKMLWETNLYLNSNQSELTELAKIIKRL